MENIEVALRVRPINQSELENDDMEIWNVQGQDNLNIIPEKFNDLLRLRKLAPGQKTQYSFNKCYDKTKNNQELYDTLVKRIALSSIQGINGTVFMYGQTGSGKTYTMMGQSSLTEDNYKLDQNQNFLIPTIRLNAREFQHQGQQQVNQSQQSLTQSRQNRKSSTESRKTIQGIQKQQQQLVVNNLTLNSNSNKSVSLELNCEQTNQEQTVQFSKNGDFNYDGILVKALKDIFSQIEKEKNKQFLLRCSYVEIYTDFVYDLLKPIDQINEVCTINEDYNKEFYIKGATEELVTSIEEILKILQKGEANRHYASTAMNHISSRSHTIFRFCVRAMSVDDKTINQITESILNFVDLAGSEKIDIHNSINKRNNSSGFGSSSSQSLAIKDRQNESKNINKSLFFLTQVISLKSQGKPDVHIPYRNSPLTKILRSSLGGNSRTAIILCINPCLSQIEQTISTLRFGLNAKKIENNIKRNIISDYNDEALQILIKDYEKKIIDMEKEKEQNKSLSDNFRKTIQTLTEQKQTLMQRLYQARKDGFVQNTQQFLKEIIEKNKSHLVNQAHIHYNGVGIIPVLESQKEPYHEFKYDFEGQYALTRMKQISQQCDILEEKNELQRKKLELNNSEFLKLDQKVQKKKSKLKTLRSQKALLEEEVSRLNQIIDFFNNKNQKGLKRLNQENLVNIEQSLTVLIDNIKTQKTLLKMQDLLSQQQSTQSQQALEIFTKLGQNISNNTKQPEQQYEFPSYFFEQPQEICQQPQQQLYIATQQNPIMNVTQQPTINPLLTDNSIQQKMKDLDSFLKITNRQQNKINSPELEVNQCYGNTQIYSSCNSQTSQIVTQFSQNSNIPIGPIINNQQNFTGNPLETGNNLTSFQNYFKNNSKKDNSNILDLKQDSYGQFQSQFSIQSLEFQQASIQQSQQSQQQQQNSFTIDIDVLNNKLQLLDQQLKKSKEEFQSQDQELETETTQNFKIPLQHLNTEERENRCITNSSISELKDESDNIILNANILPQLESNRPEKIFGKENLCIQSVRTVQNDYDLDKCKYQQQSQQCQPLQQFHLNMNQFQQSKLNFKKNSKNQLLNMSNNNNICDNIENEALFNSNSKGFSQTVTVTAKPRISDVDLDMLKVYSPCSNSESSLSNTVNNNNLQMLNKKTLHQTTAI